MDRLSTEKESPNETRKSPRVKKRPAEDSDRKSSRKGKPKRRKEFEDIILSISPSLFHEKNQFEETHHVCNLCF